MLNNFWLLALFSPFCCLFSATYGKSQLLLMARGVLGKKSYRAAEVAKNKKQQKEKRSRGEYIRGFQLSLIIYNRAIALGAIDYVYI